MVKYNFKELNIMMMTASFKEFLFANTVKSLYQVTPYSFDNPIDK
jgi:hypothetical protein